MKSKEKMFMKNVLKTGLFDFSDYPANSKFFDPTNKKSLGKMEDEYKGETITEFVGLKSKMYSKAKGVNKNKA